MNTNRFIAVFFISFLLISIFSNDRLEACSLFKLTAKDGTILVSRTMEFGSDLKSEIMLVPRGRQFTSPSPQNKTGLRWKSKYGYVAFNIFNSDEAVVDGINEAGLSFASLWFEKDMEWQVVAPGEEDVALADLFLGTWILGNFSTVGEVREEIKKVKVFGCVVPELDMAPPQHFSVSDASGGSIVIEYSSGKLNIYDNPIGIMTNSPNFPWMVTNLRNYLELTNEKPSPQDYCGVELNPTGHGSGMLGLPGDPSPPSRFVRLAVNKHFADQPENTEELLNLAEHMVNDIDIIGGTIVDRDSRGKITSSETTQWTSFYDLTNRMFYFRTYENLTLRKIDLNKLDFNNKNVAHMSISEGEEVIVDVTNALSGGE